MENPSSDVQLVILGMGVDVWSFEHPMKRWDGQRFERYDGALAHQLANVSFTRDARAEARLLEQLEQHRFHKFRIERGTKFSAGAFALYANRHAPELGPVVVLVENLEANELRAGPGVESERE